MKRAVFILVLSLSLTLTAGKSFAQRALPGMRGLELRTGMVDGWYSSSPSSATGYYFGLAMNRYAKNANKWVYGVEYLNRSYPYKSGRIPMAQFTGEGGYYYKFLTDTSKTFFLYLGGTAMAGYETVNWGDRHLSDGSTLQSRDRFIYGGAVTLEAEAYLADRIILSVSGRERVLWGTTSGHFHTQFGIALKFIID